METAPFAAWDVAKAPVAVTTALPLPPGALGPVLRCLTEMLVATAKVALAECPTRGPARAPKP